MPLWHRGRIVTPGSVVWLLLLLNVGSRQPPCRKSCRLGFDWIVEDSFAAGRLCACFLLRILTLASAACNCSACARTAKADESAAAGSEWERQQRECTDQPTGSRVRRRREQHRSGEEEKSKVHAQRGHARGVDTREATSGAKHHSCRRRLQPG